ncbi:putative acetyltransferase [Hordeum vulgare]|nr:putative acetyltransferase [Hordeum vulgare]
MVRPEPVTSLSPVPETTIHLTSWDLRMITLEYNKKGILLPKPPTTEAQGQGRHFVQRLASSFARALGRFYPYAGCLTVVTASNASRELDKEGESIAFLLRCSMEGVEFLHAVAPGLTVADVLAPRFSPELVRPFFPLEGLHGVDAASGNHPLLGAGHRAC